MAAKNYLLASLILLHTLAAARTQLCFFGPDSLGNYLQKVVPVAVAQSCEDCICAPLKETCLLGPDSVGNFATSEVTPEFAEACPRETCTCSSHDDYVDAATERLLIAKQVYEVNVGVEFESGIDPSLLIDGDVISPRTPRNPELQEETEEVEVESEPATLPEEEQKAE